MLSRNDALSTTDKKVPLPPLAAMVPIPADAAMRGMELSSSNFPVANECREMPPLCLPGVLVGDAKFSATPGEEGKAGGDRKATERGGGEGGAKEEGGRKGKEGGGGAGIDG